MARTLFKFLCLVEDALVEDNCFSEKTCVTIKSFISFIESGVFTKSDVDKFIVKNFRYSVSDLVTIWNNDSNHKPKTQNTFRGQISILSNYILSIFSCSLDEFESGFYNNDEEFCDRVNAIIYAFLFDDSVVAGSFSVLEGYITDKKTEKVFDLVECKNELSILKTLNEKNIKSLISSVDIEKLSYILSLCHQPLIKNEFIELIDKKKSVKVARLNEYKVSLCKYFQLVDQANIEEMDAIPVESRDKIVDASKDSSIINTKYLLDIDEELSKILDTYISKYEAYEVSCISQNKPNKFLINADMDDYDKAKAFIETLTTTGFRNMLASLNPYHLVSIIKESYIKRGD